MDNSHKILLFQRILPSYRVGVFKKLQNELGIIPCYSNEKSGHSLKSEIKDLEMRTEKIPAFYPGKSVTFMFQNVFKVLRKYKPKIIISEGSASYGTLWLLFILKPFFGYKLITWSHGIKNKEIFLPFSSLSSKINLWQMRMADANIFYSERRKSIIEEYISDKQKLFVAPNTLDLSDLKNHYLSLSTEGKSKIKLRLNWQSSFNLIFIGRLLKSKNVELLVDMIKTIPESLDVSLHIIGDGPEAGTLRTKSGNDKRIIFYGDIHDRERTGEMLFASDIMVMPGYVGLAVVHAFAYGCPVFTSISRPGIGPFHSPEAEYINDKNGCFLDGTIGSYSKKIVSLYNERNLLQIMSDEAVKTSINEAGIKNFISGFNMAINYVS